MEKLKNFLDQIIKLLMRCICSKRVSLSKDFQNKKVHVPKFFDTCKKVCQQQLYQSWWALGELLEKELEPELDALEDILRCNAKGN